MIQSTKPASMSGISAAIPRPAGVSAPVSVMPIVTSLSSMRDVNSWQASRCRALLRVFRSSGGCAFAGAVAACLESAALAGVVRLLATLLLLAGHETRNGVVATLLPRRVVCLDDGVRRLRRIIRHQEEIEVAGGYLLLDEHAGLQPAEQPSPIVPPEENDRKLIDLSRLDQRQGLERFIERAETARKDDEGARVLDEHRLPDEEVPEVHERVDVRIGTLLERKLDVAADRSSAPFLGALVGGLHDAGACPGNDGESGLGEELCGLLGREILGIVGGRAGGAEDGDAALDLGEVVEALDELTHNAQHAPGVRAG